MSGPLLDHHSVMRNLQAVLPLVLSLLASTASSASQLASPFDQSLTPTERLEALAGQMRQAHESLETLRADFAQVKESSLLMEADRSHGAFYYAAPDRVRWEYSEPEPTTLVIADRRMTTWYRDLAQAETAEIGEQSDRVLRYLGAGTSLDELVKYFKVTMHLPPDRRQPLRLELTPRFERVAKRIQRLELWLDSGLFLPVRLEFVEGDGDVTMYEFENLRRNEAIPDEMFELDLPPSVSVRKVKLESSGAAAGER